MGVLGWARRRVASPEPKTCWLAVHGLADWHSQKPRRLPFFFIKVQDIFWDFTLVCLRVEPTLPQKTFQTGSVFRVYGAEHVEPFFRPVPQLLPVQMHRMSSSQILHVILWKDLIAHRPFCAYSPKEGNCVTCGVRMISSIHHRTRKPSSSKL